MICSIPSYQKVRKTHEKYYEYAINIRNPDGCCRIIHRRYNHFFNFQHQLLELFPKEAGTKNPEERTIPVLPGKVLIRTQKERELAAKRCSLLETYCNKIFALPNYIQRHKHVAQFFACTEDDAKKSAQIDRPQASPDDISTPAVASRYTVTHSHVCSDAHGVEFAAEVGESASVLRKADTGYWLIEISGRVGWFPAQFLAAATSEDAEKDSVSTSSTDAFVCVHRCTVSDSAVRVAPAIGDLVVVVRRSQSGWWTVRWGCQHLTVAAVGLRPVADRVLDQGLLTGHSLPATQATPPPTRPSLPPPAKPPPVPPLPSKSLTPATSPPVKMRPPPPIPPMPAQSANAATHAVSASRADPRRASSTSASAAAVDHLTAAAPMSGDSGLNSSKQPSRRGLVRSMASRFEKAS